jgi:hypothetical protein
MQTTTRVRWILFGVLLGIFALAQVPSAQETIYLNTYHYDGVNQARWTTSTTVLTIWDLYFSRPVVVPAVLARLDSCNPGESGQWVEVYPDPDSRVGIQLRCP